MSEFPVIIVDDDACILRILETHLSRAGYDVYTCSDGNEALKLIQHHKKLILLTDWEMPGITGLELCERLRGSEFSNDVSWTSTATD